MIRFPRTFIAVLFFILMSLVSLAAQDGKDGSVMESAPVSPVQEKTEAVQETQSLTEQEEPAQKPDKPASEEDVEAVVKEQTEKAGDKPEPVVQEDDNTREKEIEQIRPVKVEKKERIVSAPSRSTVHGFLQAEDRRMYYGRIPGITLPGTEPLTVTRSEKPAMEIMGEVAPVDGKINHEMSFGLKTETADLLAKVSILVLILVIIALYRLRIGRANRRIFSTKPSRKNKR